MKERPILFSAPMVRAILAGTKTQTRRVVKPQPPEHTYTVSVFHHPDPRPHFWAWTDSPNRPDLANLSDWSAPCPYGQPGDRLWVRETWRHTASSLEEARAITEDIASGTAVDYRATYIERCMRELGFSREDAEMADDFERWRPSIHMPLWASRIVLEITGVRVERLQDISRGDAMAEGCPFPNMAAGPDPSDWYRELWNEINGLNSWTANPWVWVVEFKRVKP